MPADTLPIPRGTRSRRRWWSGWGSGGWRPPRAFCVSCRHPPRSGSLAMSSFIAHCIIINLKISKLLNWTFSHSEELDRARHNKGTTPAAEQRFPLGVSHMMSTLLSVLQNAVLTWLSCKSWPLPGAFWNWGASSSREGSACFFWEQT